MLYLALGCLVLLLLVWGRRKVAPKRREWRFITAAFAVAAFAAAAYVGLRGAWGSAIVLVVLGLGLALSSRQTSGSAPQRNGPMGVAEARSILGVSEDATPAEVKAAYIRLMRLAHPDKGGTSGLAAQLTAARDRLLRP